jgi:hypothetical protein
MTTAELVHGYASGAVTNDALIWKAGMEEWQSPFDIPALALALQARGFSRPAVVPTALKEPKGDGPLPIPNSSAEDWEGDDAATRVADTSLRFPGRPLRAAEAPEGGPGSNSVARPNPSSLARPDAVRVDEQWHEEDDEETLALGDNSKGPPVKSVERIGPGDFDDEATEVIAPDRARELLALESERNKTLPPPPPPPPSPAPAARRTDFDDEEATQILGEAQAEALLSANATPHASSAPAPAPALPMTKPRLPDRPLRQPPRAPPRAATAAMAGKKPDSGPPVLGGGPTPAPPRPNSLTETPELPPVEPVDPVSSDKRVQVPTPKPAAGVPPLASLAPPKPSSAPPPAGPLPGKPLPVAEAAVPGEPSVVVAEPPKPRPMIEAALQTMPRTRTPLPPSGPALRAIQNEPTRVVRVVTKKGPGASFWLALLLALAAAAAGGFVVSHMLQNGGAPSWLKRP